MPSPGILRRVALVRTDVLEELSASFIRARSSSILVTLMKEALSSSETSFLTRARERNIPADGILHSHSRENLKSYEKILILTANRGFCLRTNTCQSFTVHVRNVSKCSFECLNTVPEQVSEDSSSSSCRTGRSCGSRNPIMTARGKGNSLRIGISRTRKLQVK
jgi:hypothetical protein